MKDKVKVVYVDHRAIGESYQVHNDEWIMPIPQKDFRLSCCDCGLVHRTDFKIKGGKVAFRVRREPR